jgi:hypothetical protein
MIANTNLVKEIERDLRNSGGRFRVVGKTCDGARFPEGNHYYIVEDLVEQKTHHVPVDDVDEALFATF